MRHFFQADGELTIFGRKVIKSLAGIHLLAISFLCFLPQWIYPNPKGFLTPGIFQVGRLYFLLTPFNSLVNGDEIESLRGYFWILLQNLSNVFLLFPFVLSMLFLKEGWRSLQKVLLYTFFMSLTIECTQLLLDLLIDAGRVFEIDDLWTNTLGGLLAYHGFVSMNRLYRKK
ncbi:VanZ family protein [Streptococcus sp. X16XC17]|uniref:VanZ family protein n=1 Tax=unclassified Streptococcus TaxID=2608887 RepID=UPI00066FB9EC|nr:MULTISPECIES: VanZ family protein [unclassified Streptococcus]TCD46728.1 VanZ family protein [Streptococcus sp. X16XC17]